MLLKRTEKNSVLCFGYDELFKIMIKAYFDTSATVITDYETIALPKRADLLILTTKAALRERVQVFTYFKEVNIIEFKSEQDTFRMNSDLYKIGIYCNGVLLKEKKAGLTTTTFTLVTARRPVRLLRTFRKQVREHAAGVYQIEQLALVPVYVVVIEELPLRLEKESLLLKEFTTARDRKKFLPAMVEKYLQDRRSCQEYLAHALWLYREEVQKIVSERGIRMSNLLHRLDALVEEIGLKNRYIADGIMQGEEEGIRRTARNMLREGLAVTIISRVTGLTGEEIETLR